MRMSTASPRREPSESRSNLLDRFDLVAEEVDAGGQPDLVPDASNSPGEVDIDDPAADGEVARHFHLLEPVVPVLGEPDDQLLRLQVCRRL